MVYWELVWWLSFTARTTGTVCTQEAILRSNNSNILFRNWVTSSWFAWWCEKNRRDFICTMYVLLFFSSVELSCFFVHGNCMVIWIIITNSEVIFHSVYAYIQQIKKEKKPASNTIHACDVDMPSSRVAKWASMITRLRWLSFGKKFYDFFMCLIDDDMQMKICS